MRATTRGALILGGADCLRADVEAFRALDPGWSGIVIATNETAIHVGPVRHWATLHPEKIPPWRGERRKRGHPEATVWSHSRPEIADRILPGFTDGSSGLYAVSVALYLGCDRIVLCGVPMDDRPNVHRGPDDYWTPFKRYRLGWTRNLEALGAVRSMSGWTREMLGAPDSEWLGVNRAA